MTAPCLTCGAGDVRPDPCQDWCERVADEQRFTALNQRLLAGDRWLLRPPKTVYYARRLTDGAIKIGSSWTPAERARSLRCELLATEPGGRPNEGRRILQFAAARQSGTSEWFDPTPDLLAHIAAVAERALPSSARFQCAALTKAGAQCKDRTPCPDGGVCQRHLYLWPSMVRSSLGDGIPAVKVGGKWKVARRPVLEAFGEVAS